MDILDFVPFLGFIRNDEETISIMAEASVVIPKVCDILGISLSYSESDEEAGEGREGGSSASTSGPQAPATPSSLSLTPPPSGRQPSQAGSSSSMTLARLFTSHAKDQPQSSTTLSLGAGSTRKRQRVDLRNNNNTATSHPPLISFAGSTTAIPPSTNQQQQQQQLLLPPKKRRVAQSFSATPTATHTRSASSASTSEVYEDPIRQKLRQDVDIFNDKIRQLAALERQKNRLLENLLSISASLGQSSPPTPQEPEEDEEGQSDEDLDLDLETETDLDTDPDHDIDTETDSDTDDVDTSDMDDDDPEEEDVQIEEMVTTEVVEEQIVPFDTIHLIEDIDPNSGSGEAQTDVIEQILEH